MARNTYHMTDEEIKQEIRSISAWLEDVLEDVLNEEDLEINIVGDQRRLESLQKELESRNPQPF